MPMLVMYLWNTTLAEIFSIKTITYFQALGLFVLSRILFGGFGNFRKHKHLSGRHYDARFMQLNDEERKKLSEEWKKRKPCDE